MSISQIPVVSRRARYTVAVTSTTGTEFTISRADTGATTYTCDAPGEGGCPTGGEWAGTTPAP